MLTTLQAPTCFKKNQDYKYVGLLIKDIYR